MEQLERENPKTADAAPEKGKFLCSGTAGTGMKTECRIRTAVPADAKKIDALFREMLRTIYHTDKADGYEAGYLDQYWDGGENRIFVAEDDEVRAFLSVQAYREPEETYLYADDFSVTAAYRGRGIGTRLMKAAEDYARETGIPAIVLHVEKNNGSAFRFYERLGYSIFRDDGDRYLLCRELAED